MLINCLSYVVAEPTYYPYEGKKPLTVTFSFPGGELCDKVVWSFGDGNVSNKPEPQHTYAILGMYYPTCSCELPGLNISWKYDYIYVIPWDSSNRDTETGGRPADISFQKKSDTLNADDLKRQATALGVIGLEQYAAEAYAALAEISDMDAATLSKYGSVLKNLNQYDKAKEVYARSIAKDKQSEVLKSYAEILITLGQNKEALSVYDDLLLKEPENSELWTSYARLLTNDSRIPDAISAYKKTLTMNSAQPGAWTEFGRILSSQNLSEEAAKAYGHAVDAGMTGQDFWNEYAKLLQKLGRGEEAQKAKEKAMNYYAPVLSSYSSPFSSGVSCSIGSLCA